MKVMPCACAYSASAAPGHAALGGHDDQPSAGEQARHRSQNATSKLGEANCSTRLCGPMPNRSLWVATSLATPAWDSTTPLGRPVEPEV